MVNEKKVAIVGCGFVGSSSAFALMQSGLFSEMVLIDVDKNRAEGEALDIAHGMTFAEPMKIYAGDYSDVADAAMIVVTAGAAQKPGETRLDLVNKNVNIFKNAVVNNGVPVDSAAMSEVKRVFKTFTDILGILKDRWTGKKEDASSKDYDDLMQAILDIRQECRAQKQYALADAIRDKLAALGITIEDSPQGARWKK